MNRQQDVLKNINKFIKEGLPEWFNIGKLVLLKKEKGTILNLDQCRTIQVNSLIVKIMEKMILNRFNESKEPILNVRQKGFVK